jgi:hypothetical protein
MKRLTLFTFLLLGFCGESAYSQTADQHAPKVLSSSLGRYVFGQVSDFRRDRFMLDTQTGRLWVVNCIPLPGSSTPLSGLGPTCENGMQVLEPVPYGHGVNGFSSIP